MNIKTPIVSAPAYTATTPVLVAKVIAAGGFGFLAAGIETPQKLKQDIAEVRSALKLPTGVPVPLGVGFVGWILDMTESSDDPHIPAYLEELPSAIWFAFGTNLGQYVAQVRVYDAHRQHRTTIFVIVNSVADALRAANEWKVDVLVVQGSEAGGHGSSSSPPLFDFLQAILKAIPDGPLIIAAGGIATGAQIGALLTMGASGVALGTRFLFTPECMFPDDMKAVLVECGTDSTARSYAYDEVYPTPITANWPAGIDGWAVVNNILADYKQGLSLEERRERLAAANAKGDKSYLLIWAGMAAELVNMIKDTSDVMRELHEGTVTALKSASHLIQ